MPIERYKVGKNAHNRRPRIAVSGDSLSTIEGAKAIESSFSAIVTSERRIEEVIQWATAALERAGMPLDPNAWTYSDKDWRRQNEYRSAQWFAIEILYNADRMRRMIEKGDARMAADFALALGELITEAYFILEAFPGTARRGGKKKAARARPAAENGIAECRRQAAEKWNQRPDRTAAEIARYIKVMKPNGEPYAPGYIRKKIADLDPKKR